MQVDRTSARLRRAAREESEPARQRVGGVAAGTVGNEESGRVGGTRVRVQAVPPSGAQHIEPTLVNAGRCQALLQGGRLGRGGLLHRAADKPR